MRLFPAFADFRFTTAGSHFRPIPAGRPWRQRSVASQRVGHEGTVENADLTVGSLTSSGQPMPLTADAASAGSHRSQPLREDPRQAFSELISFDLLIPVGFSNGHGLPSKHLARHLKPPMKRRK